MRAFNNYLSPYMPYLLPALAIAFMTAFGCLIVRLMKPKKVDIINRVRRNAAGAAVLREEEDEGFLAKVEKKLLRANVGITLPIYVMIMLVSAVAIYLAVYFLTEAVGVGLIISLLGFFVPMYIVDILARRKSDEFSAMFVKSLKRLSASIKADASLEQAIEEVATSETMPPVIREHFAEALADYRFSGDIAKAFNGMYERTGDEDVRGVAVAIGISARYGASLAAVFDSYASVIMGRKEMEAEGRAELSSTKTDTIIVCAVPFAFGAAMKFMQPTYFDAAYAFAGGLGRYILIGLYGIVVGGLFYLLKKCDIKL